MTERRNGNGDSVLAQLDFDRNIAEAILRTYGKIPEFGEWRSKGFKMQNLDLANGNFTIASPSAGPIDYALIDPATQSIARRSEIRSVLTPRDVSGRVVEYWSGNYQQMFTIRTDGKKGIERCTAELYYVKTPHETKPIDMVPLARVAFVPPRQNARARMDIQIARELYQEIASRVQRGERVTPGQLWCIVRDDPFRAEIPSSIGELGRSAAVPLRLNRWVHIPNTPTDLRLRRDVLLFELQKRVSGSRGFVDSMSFPSPRYVEQSDVVTTANAQGREWVETSTSFPVTFAA